ncbi:hypothetical protein DD606_25855 [Enterobacter cloacae complex sp. GF14B]|nr:hypothetical protein DD606_25855 [Enterobacter cloacae complex sp. GF14B]
MGTPLFITKKFEGNLEICSSVGSPLYEGELSEMGPLNPNQWAYPHKMFVKRYAHYLGHHLLLGVEKETNQNNTCTHPLKQHTLKTPLLYIHFGHLNTINDYATQCRASK